MIVIHPHTKISEVIKADPASIDAIAALAKPLRKLKNPLLRRILASRVTIAEAAAIGGVGVDDFMQALKPLSFKFSDDDAVLTSPATPEHLAKPDWLTVATENDKDIFDVRELIEGGNDPLKAIMQRYQALPQGGLLCIVNSFIPYPLITLLEKKGVKSYVETLGDKLHYTWFLKDSGQLDTGANTTSNVVMHDEQSFSKLMGLHTEAQLRRIDVRDMHMPVPMQTILGELAILPQENALYVQHKRIPFHLVEELAGQQYAVHIHEVGEGDVRLLIVGL